MDLSSLQTATFKGVEFPCNDTTTTVGRSFVEHSFANSNIKNQEDQGGNPRVFQLTAIITGINYELTRDRLLKAIEEAGVGVLIHPFYGRFENVVAMPVTYNESMDKLGTLELPITFKISDSEGIPAVTQLSVAGITNRRNATIAATTGDFSDTFSVSDEFVGNFNAAQDSGTNLVTAINNNVKITSIFAANASEFFANLNAFSQNINALIGRPKDYGEGITGLINDITGLYDTSAQTYDVARRFFTFGDDDTPITPTTASLTERKKNNQTFNEAVQISALAVAYDAATRVDYRTIGEVDEVSRQLDAQYRKLRA